MALTVAQQTEAGKMPSAPMFLDRIQVTFDNSYPTGGEAFSVLALAQIGKGKTLVAVPDQIVGVKIVHWDRANDKLQVLNEDLTEVANASDQSAVIAELAVFSQ